MFISILLVRRFTKGDTLEEYAQKNEILEEVPDTTVTTPATGAATGASAADAAVNASTGSGENEEEIMPEKSTRPEESMEKAPFSISEIPDDIFARMQGKSYPDNCSIPREDLRYLKVQYIDFNGATQQGELVCNKAIAQDLLEIFQALYEAAYPIQSIRLIDDYNADDDVSVAANNTSCFCYRVVDGTTKLSNHAKGLAIDINPLYNPYVKFNADGSPYTKLPVCEPYIDRSDAVVNPYRIDTDDLCYQLFIQHGFRWGGAWKNSRDYQHFEK